MSSETINFNCINNFIKSPSKIKLVLSGLLKPFDLFLIKYVKESNKKIIFITLDEQTALKAQKDLKNLLNIESEVFPTQEISFYSELEKNYYIYEEQINIIFNQPDIIFMPVKSLFEKFNNIDFYKNNIIEIKKDDTLDYSKIAEKLTLMGYKRTTQVTDIGEFALRGDILDIYTLDKNPVRIEFFADTVEDIRYFYPNNQKSYEHVEKIKITPLYKFILNNKNKENFKKDIKNILIKDNEFLENLKNELAEKIDEIGYFEGIEYYLN